MITPSNDKPVLKDTARSLATLIIELNKARRNSSAYPSGHPVIAASFAKVLLEYDELLNTHEELILGVTSDALMVDGVVIEKSNVVYRDFSRILFERGIGALVFRRGLTPEELSHFTTILNLKRDQIIQYGGIEQVWSKSPLMAISIRPIRYDLFQATDDDAQASEHTSESGEGLWDRFARELTLGTSPHGSSGDTSLDPEILAEVLNQRFVAGSTLEADVHTAITDFLAPGDDALSSLAHTGHSYEKLATFLSNLTPELRRQFLDSSFGAKSQDRQNAAERILSNLSNNAILETLEDINNSRLNVSSVVFGLLQRLGQNASSSHTHKVSEETIADSGLSHKLKTIFREHASEEFLPGDYREKLDHIIASDQIPRLNMEEVTDLLKTFENHSIENSIGHILLNLIREGDETPEERDLLLRNFSDMFGFYLQTGDYGQLHTMIDQLADGTFPASIQYRLRDEYGRREFLDEILDGLSIWGKPRYGDIRSLIHKIGGQFVEAILDRLSEEKHMSLRRFYMDCLIEMGSVTRVPIINRLYDKRWYFLRNLLIILSTQNNPSVIPLIRPLLRSGDLRLRHEVLKTLVHFHDPQAEKQILDDLGNQSPELQAAAIQLAERCTSPAITTKLISMVSQGGFSPIECERKSAIVHTLGEIGRVDVLPELAKILSARSLFHSRQLTQLKSDIIGSLPKYPPEVSRPVLESIAEGSGDIARLATETLRIISRNRS